MKLHLIRDIFGDHYTLGKLYIDNEEFCYTCEDKVREKKIYGVTAIPTGTYKVIVTWSNRFQKILPLLMDVPGFAGIRIHSGNSDADTDGCILVGLERTAEGVARSRDAMAKLMPKLNDAFHNNEEITIEVA